VIVIRDVGCGHRLVSQGRPVEIKEESLLEHIVHEVSSYLRSSTGKGIGRGAEVDEELLIRANG
jgi:hypothetical protein